jgi:hypothetical protein
MARYPSGQRGQTVNLLANAFGGSNPPLATIVALRLVGHEPSGSMRVETGTGRRLTRVGAGPLDTGTRARAGGRPGSPGGRPTANRGNSSVVERQPSKLGVAGSNPVSRSIGQVWVSLATGRRDAGPAWTRDVIEAHVAQSVEHVLGKDGVTGSSPVMGSSPLAGRSAR